MYIQINMFTGIYQLSGICIRNTISVLNSLDPDQARHFVRPDLGPNCLQA